MNVDTLILAHGIGGRLDLPVPLSIFVVAAAMVLVVSFVALALLWPEPRLEDGPRYTTRGRVIPAEGVLAALGLVALLLVIGQILPGLFGLVTPPSRPSVAPVLVWVVMWLVVPFAAALIGDWYTYINPWRSLARATGIGRGERIGLLSTLGVWPATGLLVAFTWLELVSPNSGNPPSLGWAALVYTIFLLAVMAWAGRETGLAMFDFFTPYVRLISAISPLGRDEQGRVRWRGWLRALPAIPRWPGLWVFVAAMIGTVSYDGASGTDWFKSATGGFGQSTLGKTLFLVGAVAAIALAYWLACAAAARLGGSEMRVGEVAQRFAHTLVPIALAYAFAHYFTLVIFEGQQLISGLSDPLALGWDLFGTASRKVDFFITASEPVWYIQAASIVGGHVLGVALAHDRALADFGRDAVRSQYAMLGLMVGLTTLGLLILAG